METTNQFVNMPQVAEQATGCRGAGSYRQFAEQQGFKYIEVLNWCSSAGDWQFIASKDGNEWRILEQTNNYPRAGFSHQLSDEVYYGNAADVLNEILADYTD